MNDLMQLEPREIGVTTVEPSISFEAANVAMQDRTRCVGCCVNSTEQVLATHSATQ